MSTSTRRSSQPARSAARSTTTTSARCRSGTELRSSLRARRAQRRARATLHTNRVTAVLDPEQAHLAALLRVADFAGARVVEVGCGDGRLTAGLAERAATVFAFDPDADAVARARETLSARLADRVTYRTASATAVEIPRCAFDIVLFSWSL